MKPNEPAANSNRRLGSELARQIDDLMAEPVPPRPSVVVVGDDNVVGFTPAPLLASSPPPQPAKA